MSTYNVRKFAQPDVLKRVHPDNLIAFLTPYAAYLKEREFALTTNGSGELEYEKLAGILMNPTENIPIEMVEALYFIQEMSDDDQFDELCEQAKQANLTLSDDCTPADAAVSLWLHDPELLKRPHAEVLALKPKSFMYFQAKKKKKTKPLNPTAEQRQAMEKDMDGWFLQNKRGNGSRVLAFPANDESKTYFLVRHGMPFKREGKIEDGQSRSIFYRPEFYDVVIYDNENCELAIFNKSGAKKEREMYLALFGEHFFGDVDHFPNDEKYTLQPLITQGIDALTCSDIPGIDEIKLTEIQLQFRGPFNDRQTYRSKDFFSSLAARHREFPNYGELASASFSVKFEKAARPRTVKIRTPNVANFDRKEDSHLVETWLRKRGFVIEQEADEQHEHQGTADHLQETALA